MGNYSSDESVLSRSRSISKERRYPKPKPKIGFMARFSQTIKENVEELKQRRDRIKSMKKEKEKTPKLEDIGSMSDSLSDGEEKKEKEPGFCSKICQMSLDCYARVRGKKIDEKPKREKGKKRRSERSGSES